MMGYEIMKKMLDIGTNEPYNILICHEDKYYGISDIRFDEEIMEGIIICTEKGSKYSTRAEQVNSEEYIKRFEFIRCSNKSFMPCSGEIEIWDNKMNRKIIIRHLYNNEGFIGDYEGMTTGEWTGFAEEDKYNDDEKTLLLKLINENVPWGCCGACI